MISLNNISLYFGQRCLFDHVSYQINPGDKIGLVGKNGAGKSTLLKLISGKLSPNEGQVAFSNGLKLGYLEQDINEDANTTVREYVIGGKSDIKSIENRIEEIGDILANDADPNPALYDELSDLHIQLDMNNAAKVAEEADRVLMGLGFKLSELDNPLQTFSGGWQMRAVLAKLLIDSPDVLLLDEPTNHLDIHSIQWLENYIKTYTGSLILISHDRVFLDACVDKIVDIMGGKLSEYKCNYSQYLVRKEEDLEQNAREFKNQQKEIEKTEELINKFRAKKNKAKFAQTLIRKLDKMDMVELEEQDNGKIKLRFPQPERSGKVVLNCKDVAKSYGDKKIISKSSLEIERGQKVALVGENGSGKSTLIKMVNDEIDYEGEIELGHNVNLGYFAQDSQDALDPKKTVFKTIDEVAVGDVRKQVRGILGSFLFGGEDIDKKVSVLSGGERTRLALCKLMLEPYNFLILDEPTNHLDIRSKELLCEALKEFEGTVLVVSHDREFVSTLTEHLIHIQDHEIKHYHYGIKEYLDSHSVDSVNQKKSAKVESKTEVADDSLSYKEQKKLKNKVSKLERDISQVEKDMEALKDKIASDNESYQAYYEKEIQLEKLMEEWEEASEQLQAIDTN